jgi:hypothetical protein
MLEKKLEEKKKPFNMTLDIKDKRKKIKFFR